MYGKKIRSLRVLRGYSQEHMCKSLGIDTSKYSRIETDTQRPCAEILEQIAALLGVSIADIMSNEPIVIQSSNTSGSVHEVETLAHFYKDQKELYEKIIATQKEEIEHLLKNENRLLAMLEKKK